MPHMNEHTCNLSMAGIPSVASSQQQGSVRMTLENAALWRSFNSIGTEMVITKHGRRMFPHCSVSLSGLQPLVNYVILVEIVPLNGYKYKWIKEQWEIIGNVGPPPPCRLYRHPDTPTFGKHLMGRSLSFAKLKLTNQVLDQNGHIILQSMQLYYPRFHVIQADSPYPTGPFQTFTFPETIFMAVTAYMNVKITKLKIDHNPFAKGFRDGRMPVKRSRRSAKGSKETKTNKKVLCSTSPGLQMMPFTFQSVKAKPQDSTQQSQGHPSAWSDEAQLHSDTQQHQDYNYNYEAQTVPSSTPPQLYRYPEDADGPQSNFHSPLSTGECGAQQNAYHNHNIAGEWSQFAYLLESLSTRALML